MGLYPHWTCHYCACRNHLLLLSSLKNMRIKAFFFGQRRNIFCCAAAALLYLMNRLLFVYSDITIVRYFCRCFFNDILCPLFFLPIADILLACIDRPFRHARIAFLFTLCASLIWELLGPVINPRSVSDPLDFLCYFVGAAFYWRFVCPGRET